MILHHDIVLGFRVWAWMLVWEEMVGVTLGNGYEEACVQYVSELGVTSPLNTSIHSASKSRNELA